MNIIVWSCFCCGIGAVAGTCCTGVSLASTGTDQHAWTGGPQHHRRTAASASEKARGR